MATIDLRFAKDDHDPDRGERLRAEVAALAPWLGNDRIRCIVGAANRKWDACGSVTEDFARVRPRGVRQTVARLRELGFSECGGWYSITRAEVVTPAVATKRERLSPAMVRALHKVESGRWRSVETRTLDALTRRGLIAPCGADASLTDAGRAAIEKETDGPLKNNVPATVEGPP